MRGLNFVRHFSVFNGPGSLVQTPVGSLSHFVSGMSIACGTDPPIHRLQPGLHQRHGAVPCWQVQVVIDIYLRLKTAEFIQVLFTFLPHVHVLSGQPKTASVPPNTGLFKDLRYYSG